MPVVQKTTQKPAARKTTRITNPVKLRTTTLKTVAKKRKAAKRKRVKCNGTGNVADPTSENKYWHCFIDPKDKRMKRINRVCTGNFVFCPSKRFCTLENLCN